MCSGLWSSFEGIFAGYGLTLSVSAVNIEVLRCKVEGYWCYIISCFLRGEGMRG